MIKKVIRHLKVNWIKYGFESLAVLISILVAFALNNWNEQRKERKIEYQMLVDIQSNLEASLKDLESGRNYNGYTLEKYELLMDYIDRDLPYHVELDTVLGYLPNWHSPYFTFTAYESLKSKGIDIIRNKDLMDRVSEMYDYHFKYLVEDYDGYEWSFSISTKYNLVNRHIRLNKERTAKPIDFSELKSDHEFINMLSHVIRLRSNGITQYSQVIDKLEDLIKDIEIELEKRN